MKHQSIFPKKSNFYKTVFTIVAEYQVTDFFRKECLLSFADFLLKKSLQKVRKDDQGKSSRTKRAKNGIFAQNRVNNDQNAKQ